MAPAWLWLTLGLAGLAAPAQAQAQTQAAHQPPAPTQTLAFPQALEQRLQAQGPEAAYQWLLAQEAQRAGTEDYDRWLAQLALRLGQPEQAIAPLERLTRTQPGALGARLDLVIAYRRSGHIGAAREELERLQRLARRAPVPDAAARRIASLKKALSGGGERASLAQALSGSIELSGGYDSNANLGADDSDIELNLWGQVPIHARLGDESVAQRSRFDEQTLQARLDLEALGVSQYWPGAGWQLLAGLSHRHYPALDDYDRRGGYAGMQWLATPTRQLTLLLRDQRIGDLQRQRSALTQYRQLFGGRYLASLSGEWIDEPGARPTSRQLTLGLTRPVGQALLWARAAYHDQPQRAAGDTWRAELGGETPPLRWQRWQANAYASLHYRRDTQAYSPALFGATVRRDSGWEVGLDSRLALTHDTSLKLNASYQSTDSSLALYRYSRLFSELALIWRY